MTDVSLTELAVAIGRIEEGVKNMNERLTKIGDAVDDHEDTLIGHTTRLALLEARQSPRIHWLTILVGIVAVAGFALAIFDRLYK